MIKSNYKLFLSGVAVFLLLVNFGLTAPIAHAADPTRTELEQQLKDIEDQINQFQKQLATTAAEKQKLAAKIKNLRTEQTVLRLQIKKTSLTIDNLDSQLTDTQKAINKTLAKAAILQDELTALLKQMRQTDDSMFLSFFSDGGFQTALQDFKNYSALSASIADITSATKAIQDELSNHKQTLSDQQDQAKQMLSIKTIQQKALIDKLGEESNLLTVTKGKESTYQALLSDKQKEAAQIRSRIYDLFEASKTINFGEAVSIAQFVEKQTGVRAAFLLAILTQESNLGKNVGTCNRAGDPPEKSWKVIMKPDRDQDPFVTITNELVLNIDVTPVSCPMKDKKGTLL